MSTVTLQKSIRRWLIFFIVALILSGITASPIETELRWVCSWWPENDSSFYLWLLKCYNAIRDINQKYPFLAYGYDWLAFAHIVIAIAFIGPLKDPVKNIWVIEFGSIACILIIPLALIAGEVRGIPMYWRILDCSFGIIGIIPLTICYNKTKKMELLQNEQNKALKKTLAQRLSV
ncbi:hypothetical protein [Pollutibacter soli]|uniref:hypothetical protein n=1 Tax=Pollutibacter soli TaxID=3034157 RepID=UPI00301419E9